MSFASNMQAVALKLLLTYGEIVNISRTVEGNYNPATSEAEDTTTTSYQVYGHPSPYNVIEINGTTILATDIRLLIYSTTLPLIGDVATVNGTAHRVESVRQIRAQATDIVYELQLRV